MSTKPKYKDWVPTFLDEHRSRFAPHDWPDPGSYEMRLMVEGWMQTLSGEKITPAEAKSASERLLLHPPRFRKDHLPAVVETVKQLRTETAGADSEYAPFEKARVESANCRRCGGGGLLTVYHPNPDRENRVPATATAHCTCSLGRFKRRALAAKGGEMLAGFVDAAAVDAGNSAYRLDPPGESGEPSITFDQFKAMLDAARRRQPAVRSAAEVLAGPPVPMEGAAQ